MSSGTFVILVVGTFALGAAIFTGLVCWANWDLISAEFKKNQNS
ncbi:hypothetical protein ACFGWM_03405 [Pasteurella multocida]